MAKTIFLTKELMERLTTSLKWFCSTYQTVLEKKYPGFHNLPPKKKYGVLVGYKSNAAYVFSSNKKLSLWNLDELRKNLNLIKDQSTIDEINPGIEDFFELTHILEDAIKNVDISIDKNQSASVSLEHFENTKWYAYERFDNAIGRKIVKFGAVRKSGLLEVIVIPVSPGYSGLEGTAYCDLTGNFMVIETAFQKRKSANTNFMIRIDQNSALSLIIGHMTFPHRDHNNIVTKTVVLHKQDDNLNLQPKLFLLNNEAGLKDINEHIVRFLFDRKKNRLSSPHNRVVLDLASLEKWHEENNRILEKERPHEDLLGKYDLFYNVKPSKEKDIWKDTFLLKLDNEGMIVARYIHDRDSVDDYWEGDVHMNHITKVLSVTFQGPYHTVLKTGQVYLGNERKMFLMLNIPADKPSSINTLVGVIMGLRDRDEGIVSRLVVAVKESVERGDMFENVLERVFDSYAERSWVRPPKTKVSKFEHIQLDSFLDEGLETTQSFLQKRKSPASKEKKQ